MEKENLKTGWDSIELPRSKPSLRTDNVFAKSSLIKKDINIRLQSQSTTIPVAKKDEKQSQNPSGATLSLLSRWETVPAPRNEEINNLTKLCAEISANDGDKYKMRKEVAHPFNVKEAPIHIPYSRYRTPTNPAQAIMNGSMLSITGTEQAITGPIEKHFPVSSGTEHRTHENNESVETIPVYEPPTDLREKINVSAIIARRLGAQQILGANPTDGSAKQVLADCDNKLKVWSAQNKKPGKFTGEIGTRMDKKDIAGSYETWVRKDFFHNLQPVTGGVGMRMMQHMGWRVGQPLGKNNEGFTAPITFDVKVGRGGLYTKDEQPTQSNRGGGYNRNLPKRKATDIPNVNGKHPVSALAEVCVKRKWGVPEYGCVFEHGQAHNKNFLMKVTVQNVDYQSSVTSATKKHAKAQAAVTALKILGVLTT